MRRFKQQLTDDESKAILRACTNGVLSLVDSDGLPYGVPMSFVFDGDRTLFFHCATEGKKLQCLDYCPEASFCAIEKDDVKPEAFTTYYRSVIAQGSICRVEDDKQKTLALRLLAEKYSPGIDPTAEITGALGRVTVLRLDIRTMTGKEAIELTRGKRTSPPK